MATFVRCCNNGTTALIREESFARDEGPVFTFVSDWSWGQSSWDFGHTGPYSLMDRLLEGHSVRDEEFFVPFSNGLEWQPSQEDAGEAVAEIRERLHRAVPTLEEVMTAFELERSPEKILS